MFARDRDIPLSINDDQSAVDILDVKSFRLASAEKLNFLKQVYAPTSGSSVLRTPLAAQAGDAIQAVEGFQSIDSGYSTPPSYGTDSLSKGLSIAAELMKHGAGLQLAAFEYNNWDTHVSEAARFPPAVTILSKALGAFWNDVAAAGLGVTVVVMSEFGRRIASNADGGTDHGHGNVMMILSSAVLGGRMYGQWPGLAPAQTDLGDLAITTDSRQVLLEAITRGRGDAPANLFPGLTIQKPLRLFG